jgi:predicted nucleotide-binding protein
LTPDDFGAAKGEEARSRARQNVILELGYFAGKLDRHQICVLKRGEVEVPSDLLGVMLEAFDENGGWKMILGRELKGAGFEVDLNLVL